MSVRTAKSQWNGTLKDGKGTMNFSNYSGPYTFKSRFEEGSGTNPEELVGAAHSGCYSMFLAALIAGEGLSAESVETIAKVHLGKDDIGPVVTTIELDCTVKCEGLSQEKFQELSVAAKAKCPISRLVAAADVKLNAVLL
ncbi:MAG: OsmC family peroxiredoxin [Anaerolineales bacterium]|jgi:osmotically inducible protein OsmC|nr:OsmC family peroxiredoxin [Anaerolineales bacterium]